MSTAHLLAFDTSTESMALAVQGPAGVCWAVEPGGALASAALLPGLQRLLAQAGLTLRQVEAIAFGQGPGAFTGLRTSCAVAQGLGFGLGCRLLPVDSLLIVAEDARMQAAPQAAAFEVVVAMDARMDEAYAGQYLWAQARWQTLSAVGWIGRPPVPSCGWRVRPGWPSTGALCAPCPTRSVPNNRLFVSTWRPPGWQPPPERWPSWSGWASGMGRA